MFGDGVGAGMMFWRGEGEGLRRGEGEVVTSLTGGRLGGADSGSRACDRVIGRSA